MLLDRRINAITATGRWMYARIAGGRRRIPNRTIDMREHHPSPASQHPLTGSPCRLDMYAIYSKSVRSRWSVEADDIIDVVAGTSKDVSFLIDYLPSYLYPSGARTISQWLVGGISLGGHAAWYSLRHGMWSQRFRGRQGSD